MTERTSVFALCLVATALLVTVGCTSAPPTAPTTTPPSATPAAPPNPPAPQEFPPGPADARIFLDATGTPRPSRFVLFDNGTFVLQYIALAGSNTLDYRGTYRDNAGTLTFDWEGWSTAGPWGATGQLDGDTLTVHFNLVMGLSDFDDGVYTRVAQ